MKTNKMIQNYKNRVVNKFMKQCSQTPVVVYDEYNISQDRERNERNSIMNTSYADKSSILNFEENQFQSTSYKTKKSQSSTIRQPVMRFKAPKNDNEIRDTLRKENRVDWLDSSCSQKWMGR